MKETATVALLAADNRVVHVDDYEEHSMEGLATPYTFGSNNPRWLIQSR